MIQLLTTLALAAPLQAAPVNHTVGQDDVPFVAPSLPGLTAGPSPIINGDELAREDWPETGALLVKVELKYGQQRFDYVSSICSSTLIAPDVVLLAAHCVDEDFLLLSFAQQGLQATFVEFAWDRKANLSNYFRDTKYNQGVAVARGAVKHPDFNIFNFGRPSSLGVSRNHDIALVFLDEPLNQVPLAYLPTEDEVEQIEEGNEVEVVGWGQRTTDPYSAGLKYGGTSFINELGNYEFQVGAIASDVRKCHGDSGGPSFMAVETDSEVDYRLIGVTSHAYDQTDCNEKGGVDTRVDAYLDWIDEVMTEGCEDGTRSWCDVPGIIPPPDADGDDVWEDDYDDPNAVETDTTGDDDDDDDDSSEGGSAESKGGCSTVSGAGASGILLGLLGMAARRR